MSQLPDRIILSCLVAFFIVLGVLFAGRGTAFAATNISSVNKEHWAWNDVTGWIDWYKTNNVIVTSDQLKGYASSSVGDISLDCATMRGGVNVCATSPFKIINDGNGNLSGWAWNDTYGWISFCGTTGPGTSDCPHAGTSYRVKIDMQTGIFRGDGDNYAWNDVVGWISVNCANYNGCATSNYYIAVNSTSTNGAVIESSTYDTGVSLGSQINSVLWQGNLPPQTAVYFQIAASSDPVGPPLSPEQQGQYGGANAAWTSDGFTGPDGTSNTYYGPVLPNTSYPVDYSKYNDLRYFRYRFYLYSDILKSATPRIDEITVNWSP